MPARKIILLFDWQTTSTREISRLIFLQCTDDMTYRPNIKEIEKSYVNIRNHWKEIDDQLDKEKIGRKDTPFDQGLMDNLLCGWEYIDFFIRKKDYALLSKKGGPDMLEINHRVHYGLDTALRSEYRKAISATTEKFTRQVKPLRSYYSKKTRNETSATKIAAEIFVSIVGQPQVFIEGNHRSGSIISSWINLINNQPPFVLTVDNAISFFKPAQEIKQFDKTSRWRSLTQLPKYKKSFREFWKNHCSEQFAVK